MVEFILSIIIIGICGLLFGKADTKKAILNDFGLDLSEQNYKSKKESEYRKYAIQGMKNAINLDCYNAKNESQFLDYIYHKINDSIYGYYTNTSDPFDSDRKYLSLGVKNHYLEHAQTVISRRLEDLKNGKTNLLTTNCDFTNKSEAKHYCEVLWDKYQYPWPEDWLKKDGGI